MKNKPPYDPWQCDKCGFLTGTFGKKLEKWLPFFFNHKCEPLPSGDIRESPFFEQIAKGEEKYFCPKCNMPLHNGAQHICPNVNKAPAAPQPERSDRINQLLNLGFTKKYNPIPHFYREHDNLTVYLLFVDKSSDKDWGKLISNIPKIIE